jgi:hypothetical protein
MEELENPLPVAEVVEPVAEVVEPVAEVVEPVAEVVEPVAVEYVPATHTIEHRSFGHGMRVTTITGQNN